MGNIRFYIYKQTKKNNNKNHKKTNEQMLPIDWISITD